VTEQRLKLKLHSIRFPADLLYIVLYNKSINSTTSLTTRHFSHATTFESHILDILQLVARFVFQRVHAQQVEIWWSLVRTVSRLGSVY